MRSWILMHQTVNKGGAEQLSDVKHIFSLSKHYALTLLRCLMNYQENDFSHSILQFWSASLLE